MVGCLFDKFMQGDNAKRLLPDDWRERLCNSQAEVRWDVERAKARTVCDYIAGMTDDYAQKTYAKLFLPNQGSIYDVL